MLRLTLFLIFLIASVWLGVEIIRHPGYLLLTLQPWMVQMPIWFALIAFAFFLFLFYLLIVSIDQVGFLWFRLKNWLSLRREHQSYSKTQHGLAALIEWRWSKAEKWLLAGLNQTVEPLINYLAAARAAQEQLAFDRRDQYIQTAYQVAPSANLAIGLTQAELEIEQGQYEHALATLNHLRTISPRHPRIIKLLERVYIHLQDWENLHTLLPAMYKAKLLTSENYTNFEKNIYCEQLKNTKEKCLEDLRAVWNNIPRHFKKNPDIVTEYVKQIFNHSPVPPAETSKEIEELIRKILKNNWQPSLVDIYGKLPLINLNRQLVIAGAWLKMYGQHQELLFLLGTLCARLQLWGKAKDYFEKCLAQGPHAEASLQYGKLLEQLGDKEEAMQKYKEGLVKYVDVSSLLA